MDEAQRGLITLFDKEGVNYLVIGGFAILAHGINRETHDLDIWVRASRQNAKRVARGFERLGKRAPRDDWVTLFRESGRRYSALQRLQGRAAPVNNRQPVVMTKNFPLFLPVSN